MSTYQILLPLLQLISVSLAANILAFYPFPGVSHHKVYWPVLRELANRGHNVTMVSPFTMPNQPTKNYKEIKVKDYLKECTTLEEEVFVKDTNPVAKLLWKNENVFMLREMCLYHVNVSLQEPSVQWLIASDSKFDAVIGEFSFSEESFVALAHRFQAHYIELTSFGSYHWAYWIYGNPFDTSYISDIGVPYSDVMSFIERLHNTVLSLVTRLVWHSYYMPKFQHLADEYIRYPGWVERPPLTEMMTNVSLYLMNTHYSLNYPYPLAPHVKEVGGVNIVKQDSKLPKDMQKFMDEATNGVIYFSFGSYMQGSSVLSETTRENFIKVFSQLPQRVLWKWETDMKNLPDNVMIAKWMPQNAILSHPNCKLFITHGGFLSMAESIDKGIPMISMPIFADQFRNAKLVVTKGLGVSLSHSNLTQQSISWAINEVASHKRYKESALQQSKIFQDKPETALETAVYWIEYVLRHNGAHHLKPAISTMPWYQQAMIDVYAVLALIIFLPVYIIFKMFLCMVNCIFCRAKSKKVDKNKKNK